MTSERAKQDEIAKWERIEIERSIIEAEQTDVASLRIADNQIARYMNPPADTSYPLEFSYHLLGDARDKVVLDYGCGSGENTVLLKLRGARVCAMDISESLMNLAKQRLAAHKLPDDVRFFASSGHDIALADESVDIVFGIAILHHLELPLAAREVWRVLRKGGRAIFQEPVRNSKLVQRVRAMIPYKAEDVSPYERPLTDAELRDFARDFSAYRSRAFSLPYLNLVQVLPIARNHLFHPLARLDGMILRNAPALDYYAGVRVIEITKSA